MHSQDLKCPSCKRMFGFQNTPKILKNCQHTICINCLKTITSMYINDILDCPIDSTEIYTNKWGIKSFLTDTKILQKIQNLEFKIFPSSQKKIDFFSQESYRIQKLNQQNLQEIPQWKICNKHLQKCNFICKKQSKFICDSCILSQSHNQLDIIEYDKLLKIMTSFTDHTYKIFDEIQQISKNLCKSKIIIDIDTEISKRKDLEIHKIKLFFHKLFQKLRNQQKLILLKLETKANQSVNQLENVIETQKNQAQVENFRIQVHKLTSVVNKVYEYESIQNALLYLNQTCQQSLLIEKGKNLLKDLLLQDARMKEKIKKGAQKLQFQLSDEIIKSVQTIYQPKQNERILKTYQDAQVQVKTNLNFHTAFELTIFQNQNKAFESLPLNTQVSQDQFSQFQDQDLLLSSLNDIQCYEGITKNQITFQEPFSLIAPDDSPEEQFTPILRKEQDSITLVDEATILKFKKTQQAHFTQVQSSQLTVVQNNIKINNLRENFRKSPSKQLQRTQIKDSSRNPLTPLKNGSNSKLKRNQIPQKYELIWQAAKLDSCMSIDLTGAQLGDATILYMSQILGKSKKIKYLKLIRNKITDEIIYDLINRIKQSNIISINLSQNFLTEKTLGVLQNFPELGNIKSITLSQNKIVLRKVKDVIGKFKQKGIILTV